MPVDPRRMSDRMVQGLAVPAREILNNPHLEGEGFVLCRLKPTERHSDYQITVGATFRSPAQPDPGNLPGDLKVAPTGTCHVRDGSRHCRPGNLTRRLRRLRNPILRLKARGFNHPRWGH